VRAPLMKGGNMRLDVTVKRDHAYPAVTERF